MAASRTAASEPATIDWVEVSPDGQAFVLAGSGRKFVPWGFNYDHDEAGQLLEDYWQRHWPRVEEDFREMKQLGANVVRVHLQLGKFMRTAREPDRAALEQLGRLVALAERLGLYLDVTGLGCYHKKDVPAWYDQLEESERWAVQARFWEAIAQRCAQSAAVFCYDLMNEPVVPGADRKPGDWLGPAFAGKHFVQFITLKLAGRPRVAVARQWINTLAKAIRRQDQRHLITVGLVPWSLDRPGLTSGFVPSEIASSLDFISVHLYPEQSKLHEALATLRGFRVGKPVLIEETFPLRCSLAEFERFLKDSEAVAAGWIGFYWGKTPQECRQGKAIQDAIVLKYLELFQKKAQLR